MRSYSLRQAIQLPLLYFLHHWSYLPAFRGRYRAQALLIRMAQSLQQQLGPAPVRMRSGVTIEADLAVGMSRWILTNYIDEDALQRAIAVLLRPGDTVVDVGGNVGYFSLLCARLVGWDGHIIAFEPGKRARASMERNLALNPWARNVELRSEALGRKDGFAYLSIPPGAEHLAFVQSGTPAGDNSAEEVVVKRLDTVCSLARKVRLIKVDVEGAELDVLEGSVKTIDRCRPHLVVELSVTQQQRFGCHPLDVVAWMTGRGYKVAWIGDLGRSFCEADLRRGTFIDVVGIAEERCEAAHE